jgi:hypothetical protein
MMFMMFIPDPGSDFFHPGYRIPDPGLTRSRIPDPCQTQRISVFLTHKIDNLYSKIRSGMFIPDPGSWIWIFCPFHDPESGSRIQGWKKHRTPDPGSATQAIYVFLSVTEGAANFNFLKLLHWILKWSRLPYKKGGQESVNWCAEPKNDHLEI